MYDVISEADIAEVRDRISTLPHSALISIVMPVYNTPEKWLRLAIESVRNQIYENWELCIADDNSTDPAIRQILEEYASSDDRIRLVFRSENGHISAASNSALDLASGEFTVLFDHDDELAPYALAELVFEIHRSPGANMIYSDEDMISETGRRYMPKFKPDWSLDLFYSMNLVTHLVAYRTRLIKEVGGFREGFEGSQDYDLALRVVKKIEPNTIRHIPRILYHWRAVKGSAASGLEGKPYAYARAREAISEHFQRIGTNAYSIEAPLQINRTVYRIPEPITAVSLILSGRIDPVDLPKALVAVDYPRAVELIVATNDELGERVLSENVRVCYSGRGDHFSLLNDGAASARGEVLCFIDPTSEPVGTDWLKVLVGYAIQEEIGAVGAKLIYPDNTIKHAGYVMGIRNGIGRPHYRFRSDSYGDYMRLVVDQNVSATSSDCMVIRRSVFDEIGGFNVSDYPNSLADIDLCLRLRRAGYRIVWTPWAQMIQSREDDRRSEKELEKLRRNWPDIFAGDPFYNPNLTLEKEDLSPAFPPRPVR